jgi:SAM-dependent methyltransferase
MLVQQWLPLVPDTTIKLRAGAWVADVGCGTGQALIALACAFPSITATGYDVYPPSVEQARRAAAEAGLAGRVSYQVLDAAAGLPDSFDVITTFDVVHDAVDPRLADLARQIDDADATGSPRRAQTLCSERDALIRELAAAAGLGGRDRRLGDETERARKTVSARVRDAISKIERVHPELAMHLRTALRMGTVCSYTPSESTAWKGS